MIFEDWKRLFRFLLGAHVLVAALSSAVAAEESSEAIEIWSEGSRLAGNLWMPRDKTTETVPTILMVHGWGGEKQHLNSVYAPRFVEAGYGVVTFDYRGWGESEGKHYQLARNDDSTEFQEVREVVDPIEQLEDIRNVYSYLLSEKWINLDRVAIWGTSLGGGLALQAAGELGRFKVLVTQVGAVNSKANFEQDPNFQRRAWAAQSQRARGNLDPFPTGGVPGLRGAPDMFKFTQYDPFAFVDSLDAATLIIDAKEEELFDTSINGKLLYDAIKSEVTAKYVEIPGSHYAVYSGEGLELAIQATIDWLNEHL